MGLTFLRWTLSSCFLASFPFVHACDLVRSWQLYTRAILFLKDKYRYRAMGKSNIMSRKINPPISKWWWISFLATSLIILIVAGA